MANLITRLTLTVIALLPALFYTYSLFTIKYNYVNIRVTLFHYTLDWKSACMAAADLAYVYGLSSDMSNMPNTDRVKTFVYVPKQLRVNGFEEVCDHRLYYRTNLSNNFISYFKESILSRYEHSANESLSTYQGSIGNRLKNMSLGSTEKIDVPDLFYVASNTESLELASSNLFVRFLVGIFWIGVLLLGVKTIATVSYRHNSNL